MLVCPVEQKCAEEKTPSTTRFVPPTVYGGWDYKCESKDLVAACQVPLSQTFCAGKTDGNYADQEAAACSPSYWVCSGSDAAVPTTCSAGEAFDVSDGTCKAEASVAACSVVDPVGFCDGKNMAGAFTSPNEANPACASTYWACNWTGAKNAVQSQCLDDRVIRFNAPQPTWNFECVAAPVECA